MKIRGHNMNIPQELAFSELRGGRLYQAKAYKGMPAKEEYIGVKHEQTFIILLPDVYAASFEWAQNMTFVVCTPKTTITIQQE